MGGGRSTLGALLLFPDSQADRPQAGMRGLTQKYRLCVHVCVVCVCYITQNKYESFSP